jgi:phosphoribosylaminoimidazole-succinocarboxamide synthase
MAASVVPKGPSLSTLMSPELLRTVATHAKTIVRDTHLRVGKRYQGKVRDVYDLGDSMLLVATDRLSAFDRNLACIPLKGAVLSQVSRWWFEQTAHIVPNHVLSFIDPNVAHVKKCRVFPVEVVVRGYITGSTSTSLWTHYSAGERTYCGVSFPDGLNKNDKLAEPVITPTTKDAEHDLPISPSEIVESGRMTADEWELVAAKAIEVFRFGQRTAEEHGLLLVDTKYEFGVDADGTICLVDEIHTPDSSRYWLASTYAERVESGKEPDNIDKEFIRLWYRANCDPYKDVTIPPAPADLVEELSRRYVLSHEMITGAPLDAACLDMDPVGRLSRAVDELVGGRAEQVDVVISNSPKGIPRASQIATEWGGVYEVYSCASELQLAELVSTLRGQAVRKIGVVEAEGGTPASSIRATLVRDGGFPPESVSVWAAVE